MIFNLVLLVMRHVLSFIFLLLSIKTNFIVLKCTGIFVCCNALELSANEDEKCDSAVSAIVKELEIKEKRKFTKLLNTGSAVPVSTTVSTTNCEF